MILPSTDIVDAIIEHHFSLVLMLVDVNWFASLMEINEHIVQFLWQLGHQDDILSKN